MAAFASGSGDADDGAALLAKILEELEVDKHIFPAAQKDYIFSAPCIGGEEEEEEEEEVVVEEEEEVFSTPPLAQPDPQSQSQSQQGQAGEAEGEDGIGIGIAMSSMNLLTHTLPSSPSPAASSSSSDSGPWKPRKPRKPRKPMIKRRAGTKIWPPTPPATPPSSPMPTPTLTATPAPLNCMLSNESQYLDTPAAAEQCFAKLKGVDPSITSVAPLSQLEHNGMECDNDQTLRSSHDCVNVEKPVFPTDNDEVQQDTMENLVNESETGNLPKSPNLPHCADGEGADDGGSNNQSSKVSSHEGPNAHATVTPCFNRTNDVLPTDASEPGHLPECITAQDTTMISQPESSEAHLSAGTKICPATPATPPSSLMPMPTLIATPAPAATPASTPPPPPPPPPPPAPAAAAAASPSPRPELDPNVDRLVWALSMVPTRPRPETCQENEDPLELIIQKLFPRTVK